MGWKSKAFAAGDIYNSSVATWKLLGGLQPSDCSCLVLDSHFYASLHRKMPHVREPSGLRPEPRRGAYSAPRTPSWKTRVRCTLESHSWTTLKTMDTALLCNTSDIKNHYWFLRVFLYPLKYYKCCWLLRSLCTCGLTAGSLCIHEMLDTNTNCSQEGRVAWNP